jgi:MerR family copper efflux transcriptional regulator
MTRLTVSQLARTADVGVETIRFYERQKLLWPGRRGSKGYRQYGDEAVERLRFIRRSQLVGFTLKEIRDLLELRESSQAQRAEVRQIASEKLADIDVKIKTLNSMKQSLHTLLLSCTGDGPAAECPIITSFDGKNHT